MPDSMGMEDSASDAERLKQEATYITLPDVSDIEGQEHIHIIGPLGEMADVTASSDDEEGISNGKDLLSADEDEEIVAGTEADVTAEDLALLGDPDLDMDMNDDELTDTRGLDDTDFDGDPLNEAASDIYTTGDDLDMPAADGSDPLADSMDQGDEENDYYSLDDNNDEDTENS